MNIHKEIDKCISDHRYFCEKYLFILTDTMKLIPFKFNSVQQKLYDIILQDKAKNGYSRIIVTKARRQGISTLIESLMFSLLYLYRNTQSSIIAHEVVASTRIYEMTKRFYEFLPAHMKIKPQKANERIFSFGGKMQTYLEVFTAGEKNSARSGAYTAVHGSEVAWYSSPQQLINIINAVKPFANTFVGLESTANGMGGYFHSTWREALAGNNEYRPVFFAWFDSKEYSMEFKNSRVQEELMESVLSHKDADRFGDEELEMKTYGLSWQQINWRRYMIINKCSNHDRLSPIDFFKQEYPANQEEAFITTSNCVFPIATVNFHLKKEYKPKMRGKLKWRDPERRWGVEWEDDPAGDISIYTEPDFTPFVYRYRAGVDTSVSSDTGDANSVHIIDYLSTPAQLAATWHGNTDGAHVLGEELLKLNMFYNKDIWFCVEKAGLGESLMKYMFNYGFNQFYFERKTEKKIEQLDTTKIGFVMTAPRKVYVIDGLKKAIMRGEVLITDHDFWKECLTFVYGDRYSSIHGYKMSALNKGKTKEGTRYYDDRIISMALAWEMCADVFTSKPILSKKKQSILMKNYRDKKKPNLSWMAY